MSERYKRWILSYGLGVAAVAAALGLALLADLQGLKALELPLFLMAIGATVWYAGLGPGVVAVVLSGMSFNFFFTMPRYSFYIEPADRINFVVFVLFGLLIGWFASRRRRIEQELRLAKEQLQRLNKDLERRAGELLAANKELEAFAYSTSHDLRAPLRHLAGYTELLQKHASAVLDPKSRRYVAMVLESAKKMGDLIDDLLAFSRIGRAEAQYTLVNLGELVREASREIKEETDGRNIVWKIGGLPSLQGDRSMLRVALVNLISNAVKFTRTRPQAEIEIGCVDDKADEVVVFVRDNGVGFDMQYVHKLFGVFQRLHLPEAFEGTGIGLATVQRIVARHGGRVWAESAVDAGATFYFSAPKTRRVEA
jgi:light-regulated signal transduction histidine kinase (bacteriophytochrome)